MRYDPFQKVLRWLCAESNYLWTITGLGFSHLTHSLAVWHPLCCLKGPWNVEQIPSALSAWMHSPLAGLESRGPKPELTEFHMEARKRGTSCLGPMQTLICHRLITRPFLVVRLCVCTLLVSHVFSLILSFFFWCCATEALFRCKLSK